MTSERILSTAQERRSKAVSSAVATFAQTGFRATTIADVAAHAGISPAYVSKLFSSKSKLFVAALEECYGRIIEALEEGVKETSDESPSGVLHAMGGAYAKLIADRDLLMLQVHAQAAMNEPAIAEAVRRGIAEITNYVAARSRAGTSDIQNFMAFGQLCHLLTNIGAFESDEKWALTLTEGMRHFTAEGRS